MSSESTPNTPPPIQPALVAHQQGLFMPPPTKLYAATLLDHIQNDVFFRNYIFEVVFSLGTRYGFQAFNPNPLLSQQARDAVLLSQFSTIDTRPPHPLEQQQEQQHVPTLQAALQEINTRRATGTVTGTASLSRTMSGSQEQGDDVKSKTGSTITGRFGINSIGLLTGGSLHEGESPTKRSRGVHITGAGDPQEGSMRPGAADRLVSTGASTYPSTLGGVHEGGAVLHSVPPEVPGALRSQLNAGGAHSSLSLVDEPYVGSTVFVAADHLCRVLVDDLMVRNRCINGVDLNTAFAEAVWMLHSKLLAAYVKWAEDVMQLPVRPEVDNLTLAGKNHMDEEVLRVLLSELALFMLMYTEAANVRHLTDGLSFLFWTARFSPDFVDALNLCPLLSFADVCDVDYRTRDAIVSFRNRCAIRIDSAAQSLSAGMAAPQGSPENDAAVSSFLAFQQQLHDAEQKSPMKMVVEAMHAWSNGGAFDDRLVAWVFAISEERPFLEEVVQPLFHFLAYLEDKLGRQGWETSTRLCYEDVNDSLCHPRIVHNTLMLLGVTNTSEYNGAYSTLCSLGRREEGGIDLDKVAVWWEACVVRKMFSERRGYLRVFRDYFYGHLIPILLFHALLNFFFTAGSIAPYNICKLTNQDGAKPNLFRSNCFNLIPVVWTSLVLTHCVLLAVRDAASAWLSRQPRHAPTFASFVGINPSTVGVAPESVLVETPDSLFGVDILSVPNDKDDKKSAGQRLSPAEFSLKSQSPSVHGVSVPMIGAVPYLALPSILRAVAIAIVFFGQFQPGLVGRALHAVWYPVAALYFLTTVLVHVLTTKDGYMQMKTKLGCANWLMAMFQPNNTRYGDPDPSVLRVGRNSHMRTVLLWAITIPVAFFASFLVSYTLVLELQLVLKDYNVFERGSWKLGSYDTGFPVPGKAAAVSILMLFVVLGMTFGLTFFTLLMFGSQVMAYLFAKRHGFGQLKNWSTLCEDFDAAAALWCRRCMHRTVKSRPSDDVDCLPETSQKEHNTFSLIWNSVVEDFYHRDQLSLSEAEALSYLRIAPDQDSMVDMKFPTVWMPPFLVGPRLDKALRQGLSHHYTSSSAPSASSDPLPPVVMDVLKLILWVLHSGGVLDAPELSMLVEPLLRPLPRDSKPQKYFAATQALIRDGLGFMNDLCRGRLVDTQLQTSLQSYLEAGHPDLELEVEFALGQGDGDQGKAEKGSVASTEARLNALGGIAHCVEQGMEQKPDLAAAVRYLAQLSELHEWQDSQPEIEEVEDHLRTFIKLLYHKKLGVKGVCPAVCMSPYTTLVPVYKEGVLPCLDEEAAAVLLGFGRPEKMPATLDSSKVWLGMLTEIEPGVSQMSYIQNLHSLEWRNFQCRIAAQTGLAPREVTAEQFLPGQPLYEYEWEILTWCAGRSQLLGRQMPALATYYKATAMLLALECPCPHNWSVERYYEWLKHATGVKYQAVLSLQVLGQQLLSPKKPKDVWDAKALIAMLNHYPFLRGVYMHDEPLQGGGSVQYSVAVQGKYRELVQEGLVQPRAASISLATYPAPSFLNSFLWRPHPPVGYRPFSIIDQLSTALQPTYAIRLPRNYYSDRGVIIGSGKPENHNLGIPYVFTSLVQGNDSNMDNLMADALKMRNVVSEHMVADRFAAMFVPLLRSQQPPQMQNISDLYEVQYTIKRPTGAAHKPDTAAQSKGDVSSAVAKTGAVPMPVMPRGVADTWDGMWSVRRVVGHVRSGSGAASVYQYSVGSVRTATGEDEGRGVVMSERDEREGEAGEERVSEASSRTGSRRRGPVAEADEKPDETQLGVGDTGELQTGSSGRAQAASDDADVDLSEGDETEWSTVAASTRFTMTMQSTEWSEHTSEYPTPVKPRRPRSLHSNTSSPLKTLSPLKTRSPLKPIPSSPTAPQDTDFNELQDTMTLVRDQEKEEEVGIVMASPEYVVPAPVPPPAETHVSDVHTMDEWSEAADSSDGLDASARSFVMDVSYRLQLREDNPDRVPFLDVFAAMKSVAAGAHLAILGINPWICTKGQGTFAWLNALNETFFTFNIQSQLQYNSRIRYHYGLGDVWNKFWAITNSGMSRPCTNLHAVEDLPVGVRVVLRGGLIKLRSYLQVGKCRETHLVGMLGYMYKICSGGYESSLGRDYYLLHSRFDPLREATSWEAITSMVVIFRLWFVSAWLRVHVEMMLVMLKLRVNTDVDRTDVSHHFALVPQWFPVRLNLFAWDLAVLLFWTFLLPFLLYASTITLQHGFFRALGEMMRLHTTIWPMINFIYCKWWDTVAHISGHHQLAQYVSTGRGFGLHHVPFIHKYCLFSHTLWYYAALLITTGSLLMCEPGFWGAGSGFGHVITGFVIVMGVMFLFGTFWYTPLSFTVGHVVRDAGDWWGWMHGEVDSHTGTSHASWLRQQLEPWHNVKRTVEDFFSSWLLHTAGLLIRNGILIAFCVHLVYTNTQNLDVDVQFTGLNLQDVQAFSNWGLALFLAGCTAVFWMILLVLALGHFLGSSATQKQSRPVGSMCLTLLGMLAALLSLVACYQPFILPLGNDVPPGNVAKNIFAIIAGNVLLLGVFVQLLQLFRCEFVLWLVERVYWSLDLCFGVVLQGVLLLLSVMPFVQWMQNETIGAGAGYSAAMCQTN